MITGLILAERFTLWLVDPAPVTEDVELNVKGKLTLLKYFIWGGISSVKNRAKESAVIVDELAKAKGTRI